MDVDAIDSFIREGGRYRRGSLSAKDALTLSSVSVSVIQSSVNTPSVKRHSASVGMSSVSVVEKKIAIVISDTKETLYVTPDSISLANRPETLASSFDLTNLRYMDEANLLNALEYRFKKQHIYTQMCGILIAVNPYKDLSLYDISAYKYVKGNPHIFDVAQNAKDHLRVVDPRTLEHQPQTIIWCLI